MSIANFPSMIRGKSKGWFGSGLSSGDRFTQMKGIENKIGAFHKAQMAEQPPRIDHKVADDRTNELYYLNGGVMGVIPKPQPQGSFSRPLNMSGNTGYGIGLSGAGGTMRTQAGQRYGIALLKRRAQQLNQLDAMASGAPLAPADPQEMRKEIEEVPATPEEEKKMNVLETDISELADKVRGRDWEELRAKNIANLYNKLSGNLGQKLSAGKVKSVNQVVGDAVIAVRDDTEFLAMLDRERQASADQRKALKRLKSLEAPMAKLAKITECLEDTLKLQPRERAMAMRACRDTAQRLPGRLPEQAMGEVINLDTPPPSSFGPSSSSSGYFDDDPLRRRRRVEVFEPPAQHAMGAADFPPDVDDERLGVAGDMGDRPEARRWFGEMAEPLELEEEGELMEARDRRARRMRGDF